VFWRKSKQIEELVLRHLRQVDASLSTYLEGLRAYALERDVKKAKAKALETHTAEGKADDIRREVETELLSGALLASSRRDILELIEQVDKLANSGESALDALLLERIDIPDEVVPYIEQIAETNETIVMRIDQAIHALFRDPQSTREHTNAIEKLEGDVDRIERETLKTIFMMDLDLARKLQLRDFIELLVELSDRAEDLSDRIDIMVAERRI